MIFFSSFSSLPSFETLNDVLAKEGLTCLYPFHYPAQKEKSNRYHSLTLLPGARKKNIYIYIYIFFLFQISIPLHPLAPIRPPNHPPTHTPYPPPGANGEQNVNSPKPLPGAARNLFLFPSPFRYPAQEKKLSSLDFYVPTPPPPLCYPSTYYPTFPFHPSPPLPRREINNNNKNLSNVPTPPPSLSAAHPTHYSLPGAKKKKTPRFNRDLALHLLPGARKKIPFLLFQVSLSSSPPPLRYPALEPALTPFSPSIPIHYPAQVENKNRKRKNN